MEHLSTKGFIEWLEKEKTISASFKVLKVDFNPEEFCSLMELSKKFSLIKSTDGYVSVVTERGDLIDKSHQTTNFDFHTDGVYYPKPPNFVILYCVEPGRGDIVTTLSNTTQALGIIQEYRSVLDKLNLTYIGRDMKHYTRPLVETHSQTGSPVLNFVGRSFVSPHSKISLGEIPDLKEVTASLEKLYDALEKCVVTSHAWEKGDLMIFDNHTYVHGRFGSKADPERKLLRIWVDVVDEGAKALSTESK